MNFSPSESEASSSVPELFVDQVRQSLEHIYDLSYLTNRPLRITGGDVQLGGKPLKALLIRTIESLNPGAGFPQASREARPYQLLNLRYIQKMGIEEVANRLNISVRQVYRDLRAGEEQLAALLWQSKTNQASREFDGSAVSLNGEISRMPTNLQAVNLAEIIRSAKQVTGELAYDRQVNVHLVGLPEDLPLTADPTITQQVIVSLFSHAIRQAQVGSTIDMLYNPSEAALRFQYCPDTGNEANQPVNELIYQLVERLNWSLSLAEPGSLHAITLDFRQKPKSLLIVEDNEGVVELFRRYLTDQPVSIVSSNSAPEGLRLANELHPDLILLDVMMQDLDGWEFLRRVKREPATAGIPVIVCSVFFEPDLARSLGAAGFLPKPVTQQGLLKALGEAGVL